MADAAYPWSARLAERWGHHAPQSLIVSIVGVILLRLHPPTDPMLALGVSTALIMFVVASWLLMRKHDSGLCEHCMGEMPLNPSELAVRYMRRVWLSHSGAQPCYVVPYFAVLIGSNFLPGQRGLLIWSLVQTSMIYLILAYSTHRQLQPWSPGARGATAAATTRSRPIRYPKITADLSGAGGPARSHPTACRIPEHIEA